MKKLLSTILVLNFALGLNSCAGRIKSSTLNQVTPVSTAPSTVPDTFYDDSYNLDNRNSFSTPVAQAQPNTQMGVFKVDQDMLNDWQAKGIAVSGGAIYVSASDSSGLMKKGTVIKMNSSDGKGWKNLASAILGLRHPMDSTVTGLAISGGTIVAGDTNGKVYTIDASKGSVKTIKGSGAIDVAAGGGSFYLANGMVEKTDAGVSSRSPFGSLSANGGIGADSQGNVYAVNGNVVKKADLSGQVTDVITTDLNGGLDVAVDGRNGDIYVLEPSMVKRFNANGQLLSQFPNGATKAVSIAVDEMGFVYVADNGKDKKDSKVIKFSASADAMQVNTLNNQNIGTNDYSTYSNTRNMYSRR
jgi:hypothetical protein